jgi:hypothetical protein
VIRIKGRNEYVHRVAYQLMVGEIPAGELVCHECDTPLCIEPDHLFLGTHAINSADMVAKGRQAKGIESGNAKMNPAAVRKIRARYNGGEGCPTIAADYNIDRTTAWCIATRRTWRHVE